MFIYLQNHSGSDLKDQYVTFLVLCSFRPWQNKVIQCCLKCRSSSEFISGPEKWKENPEWKKMDWMNDIASKLRCVLRWWWWWWWKAANDFAKYELQLYGALVVYSITIYSAMPRLERHTFGRCAVFTCCVSITSWLRSSITDDDSWDLVTCFCMKPFAGRAMIECNQCNTWIHLSCAKIRKSNVPETYTCQQCKDSKFDIRRSNRSRMGSRKHLLDWRLSRPSSPEYELRGRETSTQEEGLRLPY